MNEKFTGNSENYCLFTDDGITLKTPNIEQYPSRTYYFPYGSIKKVELSLGTFFIKPKTLGAIPLCTFTPKSDDKSRLKDLIPVIKTKMKTAPNTNAVELTPEVRMKCNVCGNVFCYSISDVNESKEHENWAKVHSTMSLFSNMYGEQMMAEAERSKVVDYTHCPSCHSADLTRLGDGEQNAPAESTTTTTNAGIDEIKKFKELLDMGIITQEEFDAKKKQLLGL